LLDVLSETLPDLRTVEVSVERGEITLAGTVADRAQRLAVYRLAARVPGVVNLSDRLEIAARWSPGSRPGAPCLPVPRAR